MILTTRKMSRELLYLLALERRSILTSNDARKLKTLKRGYEGEVLFDRIFDDVGHSSVLVFRDIYLKIGDSVAQYDTLILSDEEIVLNEIKNFSGLYRFENDEWTVNGKRLPDDAMVQVKRAEGKLIRLLSHGRLDIDVKSRLVFPNVEFRLSTDNQKLRQLVVMRSELKDYFYGFKNLYASSQAEALAKLIERHIVEDPFFNRSAIFERLRKGAYCGNCYSFELEDRHFHFKCVRCGYLETKESQVLRACCDYKALFRDKKITKRNIYNLLDGQVSLRTIYRMLNKYGTKIGNAKNSYYELSFDEFHQVNKSLLDSRRFKDRHIKE